MKKHFNALEWVISEMEMKVHELKIKNPQFDSVDSDSKIKALKEAQDYVYESYEQLKAGSKREFQLECANLKLSNPTTTS